MMNNAQKDCCQLDEVDVDWSLEDHPCDIHAELVLLITSIVVELIGMLCCCCCCCCKSTRKVWKDFQFNFNMQQQQQLPSIKIISSATTAGLFAEESTQGQICPFPRCVSEVTAQVKGVEVFSY